MNNLIWGFREECPEACTSMSKSDDILRFQGSLLCISVAGIATDIRLPKKLCFFKFFSFFKVHITFFFFNSFLFFLKTNAFCVPLPILSTTCT